MTVTLDGESLAVSDVVAVVREGDPVAVADEARENVRASRERVEDVLTTDEPVYGLNTGFGELVDTRIPDERVEELQQNLVRSHASGSGAELPRELVRAMLVTRVNALLKGYSGVREDVIDHLVALLNEGAHPVVRSRGSLGASGDLAPLAYVALALIGEGEIDLEQNGGVERMGAPEALSAIGLEPLELRAKEGLALINGTQLTLGAAALLVRDAERLCRVADVAGALTTEVTMGTTASCAAPIHDARPHRGQSRSAAVVREVTAGSEVVESHRNCDRVQDAYSIRCLPQVHGAVRDAVEHLREAVAVELNSATDNPLVFSRDAISDPSDDPNSKPDGSDDPDSPDDGLADRASGTDRAAVLSGGNFHGEPLALRLDYLVGALTELAAISERRVDRILNPNLQESHLAPFLARDTGVESGLMIAQYTAAALLNECRTTGRAATDNTPVSGGQEDHVSMSATAAYGARETLYRARKIVAVELLCATEAYEYVDDDLALGAGTDAAYRTVREVVPPLDGDRRLDGDMDAVAALVADGLLEDAVGDAIGGWPDDTIGDERDDESMSGE